MANVVKPNLTSSGSVNIKSYGYNEGNTNISITPVQYVNEATVSPLSQDYGKYEEKPVTAELSDVLSTTEGKVESLLSKYHIFDTITEDERQPIRPTEGSWEEWKQKQQEEWDKKPEWEKGVLGKHGKSVYGTGTDELGNYWKDASGKKHYVDESGNDLNPQPQAQPTQQQPEQQSQPESEKKPEEEKPQEQKPEEKPEEKKPEEKPQQDNTVGKGKTTEIPDSVRQTGIIANYTQNYNTRGWSYDQGKMAKAYKAAGSQTDGNMATIDGRYLVAVSPRFGKVGDNIDIKLENGQVIHAVIADVKGDDATSSWGHELGGKVDVVEWEINGTSQAELSKNLKDKGWYGSPVTSITNTGSGNYF